MIPTELILSQSKKTLTLYVHGQPCSLSFAQLAQYGLGEQNCPRKTCDDLNIIAMEPVIDKPAVRFVFDTGHTVTGKVCDWEELYRMASAPPLAAGSSR